MSEFGVNYDAVTQPSPLGAKLAIQFDNTTLKATIAQVDNFAILVKPAGSIGEEIVSGAFWAIAQTLGGVLPTLGKSLIEGRSFDILSVGSSTQNVDGEQVTIVPSGLSLTNYNGMLMVQGSIDVI